MAMGLEGLVQGEQAQTSILRSTSTISTRYHRHPGASYPGSFAPRIADAVSVWNPPSVQSPPAKIPRHASPMQLDAFDEMGNSSLGVDQAASRTFDVSESAITAIGMTSTILSIISVGFCLFILVAAAWVYSVPEARHTIDRISFRLMVWSMVFGLGYDVCYFLAEPSFNIIDPFSVDCKVLMYWQIATLAAVNYFITCIAVNLMLSIHFACNPLTLRLERWYVGISLFVSLAVPLFPAGLGHFGADPVYDACYFTAPNLKDRLRNFVLDLYLWQGAATIIACVAVGITLVTLFRSGRATAKALLQNDTSFLDDSQDKSAASPTTTTTTSTNCPLKTWTTKSTSTWRKRRRSVSYRLQDQFLNIAVRVAIYPLVLVFMNTILTAGDLYLSASQTIDNRAEYALYIMYYILCGGRNIFLAIVGIFVDPGLPRGLRIAWNVMRENRRKARGEQDEPGKVDVEEGDMDFTSALASVPYIASSPRPSAPARGSQILSFDRFRSAKNGASPNPTGTSHDASELERDLDVEYKGETEDDRSERTLDKPSRPQSLIYADHVTGEPPAGFVPRPRSDGTWCASNAWDEPAVVGSDVGAVGDVERGVRVGVVGFRDRGEVSRNEARREIAQQNLEHLVHRL